MHGVDQAIGHVQLHRVAADSLQIPSPPVALWLIR